MGEQNLALMAYISVGSEVQEVLHALDDWGMTSLEQVAPSRYVLSLLSVGPARMFCLGMA